ncbi:NUDIX domain-containing protein [Streptomyces sp. NPDC094468]|uniref:NUDIX domain-containing protein n=1 Tax=Streptomyces sp. NPDC094468 TaxID=3366066 RepID=UPI0037F84BBA
METVHRTAARVICPDTAQRLLLLRWRDPFEGAWLWEPPGGGIEEGETPLVAPPWCRMVRGVIGIVPDGRSQPSQDEGELVDS